MIHKIKISITEFNKIISRKQDFVNQNNMDIKVNDVVVLEYSGSIRKASRKVQSIVNGLIYLKSINE